MILYSKQGIILPSQDKTNIALPLTVPNGIKEIKIKYSYSPKTVEDSAAAEKAVVEGMKKYNVPLDDVNRFLPVSNLITLSFDDPDGYRGACHRQPNKQLITIGQNSTPGIFNRKITAGEWRIVLNVHYAGRKIHYSVEAEGVSE